MDSFKIFDKILEQVKTFKLSLNRIEFKIIEESQQNQEFIKINELNKVTEIKNSILNYNRLNPNLALKVLSKGKAMKLLYLTKKNLRNISDIIHYTYAVE